MITLYHGTFFEARSVIKTGNVLGNIFDGIFASDSENVANSHGKYVFKYSMQESEIAESSDLDCEKAIEVLKKETRINDEGLLAELLEIVVSDGSSDDLEDAGITKDMLKCLADCDDEAS